ncbi:MAG: hypothetical protein ACYC1W_05965 [Gemmatimonadaceae bacterium]
MTWVSAQGRWGATPGGPASTMIPVVNSVEVFCTISTKECVEARASLVRPSDDGIKADFDALFTHVATYRIVSLMDGVLVARSEEFTYDLELRIDVRSQSAQRFARETGARGATGADSTIVYEWVLR